MRIDFVTFGSDGEEHVLARARLSYIPREGETVVLNNLRLRRDEERPLHEQRVEPTVVWDVVDVTYEMDAHFTYGTERGEDATADDPKWVKGEPALDDDVEVKVWLTPPHGEQAWPGLDRDVESRVDQASIEEARRILAAVMEAGATFKVEDLARLNKLLGADE